MFRLAKVALFVGIVSLVLASCGDDDTSASSGDDTTAGAEGDLTTYCEKSAEIEGMLAGGPDLDFDTATPEEVAEAMMEFAAPALPVADAIQAAAPEEVRADIDVLHAALTEVSETGDFGAFETPEVEEASDRDHAFALAECDWQRVDVTAVNYEFQGIPDSLDAGVTSFEFANEGTELHEMIVIRRNDDTTETFDELLALPEEEGRAKTTFMTATFGTPGDDAYAVVDLEPGEYAAVCFIPVGSVDEETEADGPPHFTQGMKHEFTVS